MSTATLEVFSGRIDKSPTCWTWTGPKDPKGYGRVYYLGKSRIAHRLAYELTNGSIPQGLTIDHLCRNRSCVNPAHLEAVTCKENVLRGIGVCAVNARKTTCPRGHRFTEENTYRYPSGWRECRTCKHSERRKVS